MQTLSRGNENDIMEFTGQPVHTGAKVIHISTAPSLQKKKHKTNMRLLQWGLNPLVCAWVWLQNFISYAIQLYR